MKNIALIPSAVLSMILFLTGCSLELFDSTYSWASGHYRETHEVHSSENTALLEEEFQAIEISFYSSDPFYDGISKGFSSDKLYLGLGDYKEFTLSLSEGLESGGQTIQFDEVVGALYEHSGFRVRFSGEPGSGPIERMDGTLSLRGWCANTNLAILDQLKDFHHTRRFHLIKAQVDAVPSVVELAVEDQVMPGSFRCGDNELVFLGEMPWVEVAYSSSKVIAQAMTLSEPEDQFDTGVNAQISLRVENNYSGGESQLFLERTTRSGGISSIEISDEEGIRIAGRFRVLDASADLQVVHLQLERSSGMRVKDYLIHFGSASVVSNPSSSQVSEAIQQGGLTDLSASSLDGFDLEIVAAEEWAARLNVTVIKSEPGEQRSSTECGEKYEAWNNLSFDYELEFYSESGETIRQSGRVTREFELGYCVKDSVEL